MTHFSSRGTIFAHRVFPNHCKLIRKSGTLRKKATLATTCNSQFVGNISGLAGIFVGKMQKNSLDTPTSGSHNSSEKAPIGANLISLESRLLKLSNDTKHGIHIPIHSLKIGFPSSSFLTAVFINSLDSSVRCLSHQVFNLLEKPVPINSTISGWDNLWLVM